MTVREITIVHISKVILSLNLMYVWHPLNEMLTDCNLKTLFFNFSFFVTEKLLKTYHVRFIGH